MARARAGQLNLVPTVTTAQQLGSIVKSARDIMRKDKGLNGDLDRLPMLTWIMFLKFLDDMEQMREEEVALAGERFRPAIEPPYRWRDWAAWEDGITGDELIAFVRSYSTEIDTLRHFLKVMQNARFGRRSESGRSSRLSRSSSSRSNTISRAGVSFASFAMREAAG